MTLFIYSFFIQCLGFFIFFFSFFSSKIKKIQTGQKTTLKWLRDLHHKEKSNKTIWMHCSSLGEFEQGRMVLEGLKKLMPESTIYLSFFSPSGYEIRKNWEIANHVFYLPLDTRTHSVKIVDTIKPDIFILVKYDFWWHLLYRMNQLKVPVYLIAAQFKPKRYYFRPPFIHWMKNWKGIYTIRENSTQILKNKGFNNLTTVGDPRVDRVVSIQKNGIDLPFDIETLLKNSKKTILYGSVWKEDMEVISNHINSQFDVLHVIVPHDIQKSNIDIITAYLTVETSLYSHGHLGSNVIIIDKIGLLSGLYTYAYAAYIGGGFGKGIHNILEPAVHQIPVFFGPEYKSFSEAVELVSKKCCFPVRNQDEFEQSLRHLSSHPDLYREISNELKFYFQNHSGASEKIIANIMRENFTA